MRDARADIVKALIVAIKAKITGINVFTKINRPVDGTAAAFPYVYISDIYQNESGSKAKPIYDYEVLIQLVYSNLTTLTSLWTNMNHIVSIIQSKRDISLTNSFTLLHIDLLNTSESEIKTDKEILNIGLIRFSLKIRDDN